MTDHIKIEGIIPHIQYVADGVLTSYSFPFAIFNANNMEVYFDDNLQPKSIYQVVFDPTECGGRVNFNVAPEANTKITLVRNLTIERTADFQEGGALRANTLNDELDYIIACQQQLADKLNRTMTLPVYAADDDVDFTMPRPDKGKAIVWDKDGKKLEASTVAVNEMENTLNGYKTEAQTAAATATEKATIASDKADIATEKAQIATDKAAEAIDTVDSKATKDLDNLSTLGKEKVSNLAMPSDSYIDYTLTERTFTAPANGYYCATASMGTNSNLKWENAENGMVVNYMNSTQDTRNSGIVMPVKTGASVALIANNVNSVKMIRFIYAQGEV